MNCMVHTKWNCMWNNSSLDLRFFIPHFWRKRYLLAKQPCNLSALSLMSLQGRDSVFWLVSFRRGTGFCPFHPSFFWEPAGLQRTNLRVHSMPRMTSSCPVLLVVLRVNLPKSWMHYEAAYLANTNAPWSAITLIH